MAQQPNILFLLTDQQRFDSLGCNGAPICRTPAIDEIAATGMRFTNAYRALFTGTWVPTHWTLSAQSRTVVKYGQFQRRVCEPDPRQTGVS